MRLKKSRTNIKSSCFQNILLTPCPQACNFYNSRTFCFSETSRLIRSPVCNKIQQTSLFLSFGVRLKYLLSFWASSEQRNIFVRFQEKTIHNAMNEKWRFLLCDLISAHSLFLKFLIIDVTGVVIWLFRSKQFVVLYAVIRTGTEFCFATGFKVLEFIVLNPHRNCLCSQVLKVFFSTRLMLFFVFNPFTHSKTFLHKTFNTFLPQVRHQTKQISFKLVNLEDVSSLDLFPNMNNSKTSRIFA